MDTSGFAWTIDKTGSSAARVVFSGDLSGFVDFSPLVSQLPDRTVFDLFGVGRINSVGVRDWVNFLLALDRTGKQYSFERCSFAVVSQLNVIVSFRGEAEVRSILAPYFCTGCKIDHAELVDLSRASEELPDLELGPPCPKCGQAMRFDDIPEIYLSFLGKT